MGKNLSEEDILREVETDEPAPGSASSIRGTSSRIEAAEEDEDEDLDEKSLEELTDIAEELADLPFEVWHAFRAEIPTLSDAERRIIGRRLARIIKRRGWDEYVSDEISLVVCLTVAVIRRVRIRPAVKKEKINAHDDSRPAGSGKNDVAQAGDPHSPFAV